MICELKKHFPGLTSLAEISFLPLFLLIPFFAFPQEDALNILQKSFHAVSQISNGTYDTHLRIKYLSRNDTLSLDGSCRFHRAVLDSLKGSKFILAVNDMLVSYDGKKKISVYNKDSLAIIHNMEKYPMKFTGSVYHLLSDFMMSGRSDLDEMIKNPETIKQLLSDTLIYNIACYQVMLHPKDDAASQNIYRTLYISKTNYFLMGDILNLDARNRHQFTELFLENVKTNINGLNDNYGTALIPRGFFIKEYAPGEPGNLLAAGTAAPPFNLSSLDGKNFSLAGLKGKLIILYFWAATEQQSRVRLAPLQKIYEKYASDGVEVLGLNVIDNDPEHLKRFLQNKKITFPQCMNAANTGEKYNLGAIPAIYAVSRSGIIIEGFVPDAKENLEMKLEKIILKNP